MKKHLRRFVACAGLALVSALSVAAFAQTNPHGPLPPPPPGGHAVPAPPRGHAAPGVGLPPNPHAPAAHGAPDAHGGDDHAPGAINWYYGLLGEKDGVAPDLWNRPKGMPVPFLANLINVSVLIWLGLRYGKKPLEEGLKKRKIDLMREIDEAGKVKAEAKARLAEYEGKLAKIDEELARITKDYAEQGVRDKERIVREAKEKRARMKRDAELLVSQEGKAIEKALLEQTVTRATAAAESLVAHGLAAGDHDRLADEYLHAVARVGLGGAS